MNSMSKSVRRCLSVATCALAVSAPGNGPSGIDDQAQAIHNIGRYCTSSWINAGIQRQEWPDCTQQVLCGLLERISADQLPKAVQNRDSSERRELNRSIWRIVQRWKRRRHYLSLTDRPNVADRTTGGSQMEPAGELLDEVRTFISRSKRFSDRQRSIMQHWLAGMSVAEISQRLNLPPARVSSEKHKGLRKLRQEWPTRPPAGLS